MLTEGPELHAEVGQAGRPAASVTRSPSSLAGLLYDRYLQRPKNNGSYCQLHSSRGGWSASCYGANRAANPPKQRRASAELAATARADSQWVLGRAGEF